MKYITSISLIALFSVNYVLADESEAYFSYEIISSDGDITTEIDTENNFGPYPSAINEAGDTFAFYATKSQLDQDIDVGLAHTINQTCFFDTTICELRFYGSEDSGDLSFENAYQAWRNAVFDIYNNDAEPESYFLAETSTGRVEGFGVDTDVKITDVYDSDFTGDTYSIGYGSAPYSDGEREFTRRGFILDASDNMVSLLADDFADEEDDDGGFTSAYKMRDVTYQDGTEKTLIIGHASQSFAGGDDDYLLECYSTGDTDEYYSLNDLLYCPGFDTQAWAWEYDSSLTELSGFALATEWLDDNEDRNSSEVTYAAAAFDINSSGIAVGTSTFEYNDDFNGGRLRAIIMTPDETGAYDIPTELTEVTSGVSEQEDAIYNTWAVSISDDDADDSDNSNIVMGNRQYAFTKTRNKPIEMFVYSIDEETIDFPLLDIKVQSTKQRLEGSSRNKNGANSQGYDMNNNGLIVGKADAYDQIAPVIDASPRTQSAFLYDTATDESWFIDDLLCTEDANGVINHPLIRLQSATAINDNGIILAEGFQYSSIENYTYGIDAKSIMVKLTPNALIVSPNDSPNCWESEALVNSDESFERSGGASIWLWLLSLPLLFIRRKFN